MRVPTTGRKIAATVAAVALATTGVAACGGGSSNDTKSAGGTSPGKGNPACAQLTQFGDLTGKTVSVYTTIIAPEDATQKKSYELFTTCTGAAVKYEGSNQMETQIVVRVKGGNAPDVAYIPQPGLLKTMVATGQVVEAPKTTAANVDKWFGKDWKGYGTIGGKFFAAPLGANVKSFVWYSPKMFKDNGWAIPQTWDEMTKLSADMEAKGIKPWCAGIESGEATGWVLTDWLEDAILRDKGADYYDKWVAHGVAFNDAGVASSLDRVGAILKDPTMVNGGIGDVKSIATTKFQDAGLPILKGKCGLHRQASFYGAQWPKGTDVSENGDVFAFYLPTTNTDNGKPVLGGGEFVAAFADRPEVQAFQTYLSSDTWANEKAKATPGGGWVSANKGLKIANLTSPIDKLSAQTLQDPKAVFRFDGSDQMPSSVGSGTFWKGMTNWITGDSTEAVLSTIDKSWPKS